MPSTQTAMHFRAHFIKMSWLIFCNVLLKLQALWETVMNANTSECRKVILHFVKKMVQALVYISWLTHFYYHGYILPFTRLMNPFTPSPHLLFTIYISSPLHPPSSSLLRHINLSLAAPSPSFSPAFLSPKTSHYTLPHCIFSPAHQKKPLDKWGPQTTI